MSAGECRVATPLAAPGRPILTSSRIGLICGLLALVLYAATGMPGIDWQDSGIHQYRILTGQLEHSRGLALSHPLHYWLGRAALHIPLGEPARRMNLVSALCGAVGAGALAALVVRVTGNRLAAAFAAIALATAHSFWQMSATTETYTLAAALMILEWLTLLQYVRTGDPRWLVLLFGINGLHVSDHLLGLLTLSTYSVFALERVWRGKLRPSWLLACAAAWIVTTAPYWTLAVGFYGRTHDLGATLNSALFGGRPGQEGWERAVLNVHLSATQLKLALLTLGYNFPSFTVLFAIPAIIRVALPEIRPFRWVMLAQTLIIGVFVARYGIVDLYTYFVPVCAIVAFWFGLGVSRLMQARQTPAYRRTLLTVLVVNAALPPLVYAVFPLVAARAGWMQGRLRDLPFRSSYAYFFNPWRFGDHSAAQFAQDALGRAGPGGWLLADSTTASAAAYWYRVHGGPSDVRIYSERTGLNLPGRPELTDQGLADFITRGGRVVVVAGPGTEALWGRQFNLDRSGRYYWTIAGP